MNDLYSDFKLTRDNCHREPIHRPEAVQGSGHILAFQDVPEGQLLALSDSQGDAGSFNINADALWSKGMPGLPRPLKRAVDELKNQPGPLSFTSKIEGEPDRQLTSIVHRHNGVLFIENETPDVLDISFDKHAQFAASLDKIDDAAELCQYGAEFMRSVLGYDRIMVYQFDDDGHGFVTAEAKRSDLEPYLGLHYPATDIPKPARDLFLLTRSRSIPDVELTNNPLEIRRSHQRAGKYVDLSRCQLRATSQIHIEYLINMGVQATMTVAIILRGELWGLFACHHSTAKNPPYNARVQAEVFSSLFSHRLHEVNIAQAEKAAEASLTTEEAFLKEIRIEDKYLLKVLRPVAPLMQLCPCDGAAIVTVTDAPFCLGPTPDRQTLSLLQDWLVASEKPAVWCSNELQDEVDGELAAKLGEREIGGVLAVLVSEITNTYIFWFRRQQSQEITWAGDPRLPQVTERILPEGGSELGPRQSFAQWRQDIRTQSLSWEPWTLGMADRLRENIIKLELKKTAELVARANSEFMQLTYAASHDLQQPIRTQLNYLSILQDELSELENSELDHYLNRATLAAERMQDMVGDLLDYAELDRETDWVEVDLNKLLDTLRSDLEDDLSSASGQLIVSDLPVIKGNARQLRQALLNLLTNAIKYRADDTKPVIEVSMKIHDNSFELSITDNGIGIALKDHQRIFDLFTRLHHRDKYAGTGIGLAITKRAVEACGGSISVTSNPTGGSTFSCLFHLAQLVR